MSSTGLPVYELRTYAAAPGRMPDLLERFVRHTVGLFAEHGMESIGYWHPVDAPDELVYLIRHHGDPEEHWATFRADPRWQRVRDESVRHGELTTSIHTRLLRTASPHEAAALGGAASGGSA